MLKLRILTDVNGVVTDKEGLKRDWIDFFEYLLDEDTEDEKPTLKEFIEQDYYDQNEYILDESTGKVVKANDFFHKVAIELIH